MNIIEAIKSGRNFRRESWPTAEYMNANVDRFDLHLEELLADDWEVEEAKVTITRAQFDEAWDRAIIKMEYRFTKDGLAKELGL